MIDVIKLVMSLFVVSLHTLFKDVNEGIISIGIWRMIANTAVPFFFMSTGFFMYRKMIDKDMKSILLVYLRKYIRLFFIWSLVYLPLAVIFYIKNDYSFQTAAIIYFKETFLSGQHYNSWILWYLLSAVYALFAMYLTAIVIRAKKVQTAVILFSVSCITYFVLAQIKGGENSTIRLFNGGIYIPLGAIIYCVLGDRNRLKQLEKPINRFPFSEKFAANMVCMFILVIGIWIGTAHYTNSIFMNAITIFTSCALFIICVLKNDRISFNTVGIRHISSTVYFVHLLIWTLYYMVVYGEKTYGIDCFVVVSLTSIFCGWILEKMKTIHRSARW